MTLCHHPYDSLSSPLLLSVTTLMYEYSRNVLVINTLEGKILYNTYISIEITFLNNY